MLPSHPPDPEPGGSLLAARTREAFRAFPRWTTRFVIGDVAVGGDCDLCTDSRFDLWRESGVELSGKRVLELGPLEGGHSVFLSRAGAAEVVGVEGRLENFNKCCLVKNVLSLDRVTFVLDDVSGIDRSRYGEYDICLASGILYHLADPAPLLARLSEMAPVVMVWTHFATSDYPSLQSTELTYGGQRFRGKWYREPRSALAGLSRRSFWPFLEDLRRLFYSSGFGHVDELAVDWGHNQGASWLGTLWRSPDLKPEGALWRSAQEEPSREPLPSGESRKRLPNRLRHLWASWWMSRLPRSWRP